MVSLRKPKVALVDGDIVLYKAVSSATKNLEIDDIVTTVVDKDEARQRIDLEMFRVKKDLGVSQIEVALTGRVPRDRWREQLVPTYKSGRVTSKPPGFWVIRDYLLDVYGAVEHPMLEGDDILGLWATGMFKGVSVVVSADKDLNTIPGLWAKGVGVGMREVTEMEADWFHMVQTLAGDSTDDYGGCPGIGMIRAGRALDKVLPEGTSIEGGYSPGDEGEVRSLMWDAVTEQYEKKGLTEDDALSTARVARILREGEFDRDKNEVNLWTPITR